MAEAVATPLIQDPPEHTQGDGPGDEEMYAAMHSHFGDRLNDIDDDVLPRFVRGYAHEENREEVTKERLEFFLDFSDKWDINNLLDKPWEPYEECAKSWQIFVYGQDKFGHPVVYDRVGSGDLDFLGRVFMEDQPPEKMKEYRYRVQLLFSRVKQAQSRKYGKMIYKHNLIFDLSGFTASHFSGQIRNMVSAILSEEQHLFPETVHKVFLINAPFIFRAAWKVISYFIDPLTYEKIKVLGSTFLSEMQREISLDQIPTMLGGTGRWPVRYGRAHSNEFDQILGILPRVQLEVESKENEDDLPDLSVEYSGAGDIEISRSASSANVEEN